MLILIILLVILIGAILIYQWQLQRELRSLTKDLKTIHQAETNMRLRTLSPNKAMGELAREVNGILDQQRQETMNRVRADRELKQGISNISHDLRTPLTSAIGYLQMVKSGKLGDEKKVEYLTLTLSRLQSLSEMLGQWFEYSQIVEGKREPKLIKVEMGTILRELLAASYGELSQKGFSVNAELPDEATYFICDPQFLERILQNLIKNVLTHGFGRFQLELTDTAILFKNQSKRLEALDPARIFERFYTMDAARVHGGSGMGLAIVKELVTIQEGMVSATTSEGWFIIQIKFKVIS